MADPNRENRRSLAASSPFDDHYIRDEADMERELDGFILSASGWRKIFGASEEDDGAQISDTNKEIVAVAGAVFARFLRSKGSGDTPILALATDTRPTGPAIATTLARALLSEGCELRYLGVSPAPEVMAYARKSGLSGFAYVSASHNPIGHNGLKFGLADGAVVGGSDANALIQSFRETIQDLIAAETIVNSVIAVDDVALERLDSSAETYKKEALAAYRSFTLEVGTMSADPSRQEEILAPIRREAGRLGIVVDFNGSARTVSIDRQLFESLGMRFESINDKPGQIVHTIVPEGDALEPCRRALESAHSKDSRFLLGYVPDNDGDRGNIVYADPKSGKTEMLRAQEVFALSVMSELAYLVYTGQLTYSASGRAQQRHAVVVNGPTSLRIDAIAKAFDVRVFRSEVGEANVVNLARDSRNSGFTVRIMGEGSNGGNITHPASVRDPLNTILAFLKLMTIGSRHERPGLYEIWCARSGQKFVPDAGLREMLASLPRYVTTDVNESRAKVNIEATDHVRFKEAYEEIFLREWDANRSDLAADLGIHTWEEINYEGMNEIHGFGRTYRSGKQRGGLKILFKDDLGRKVAFIWMRGSGTEPVFRVLADVSGEDPALERRLLDWHVSMIRRADAAVLELVNTAR